MIQQLNTLLQRRSHSTEWLWSLWSLLMKHHFLLYSLNCSTKIHFKLHKWKKLLDRMVFIRRYYMYWCVTGGGGASVCYLQVSSSLALSYILVTDSCTCLSGICQYLNIWIFVWISVLYANWKGSRLTALDRWSHTKMSWSSTNLLLCMKSSFRVNRGAAHSTLESL